MGHIMFVFHKRRKYSSLTEQLSAVKTSAYNLVIGRMRNVHKALIRKLNWRIHTVVLRDFNCFYIYHILQFSNTQYMQKRHVKI
jgi:hypothetical protein